MFFRFLLLISLIDCRIALGGDKEVPVTTVPELNLDQYLGKWYQIATIPAWFQRNCVKNTMAVYSKSENGLIEVENSCETEDGEISKAMGRARLNAKLHSLSKLQVTFLSIFGNWIWTFAGDYWVMDLGKNGDIYEYSVVGDPKREYLWILARKPQFTLEELKPIRDKIKDQLYDLSKIFITQAGELNGKKLSDLEIKVSQP